MPGSSAGLLPGRGTVDVEPAAAASPHCLHDRVLMARAFVQGGGRSCSAAEAFVQGGGRSSSAGEAFVQGGGRSSSAAEAFVQGGGRSSSAAEAFVQCGERQPAEVVLERSGPYR